mmetsp:Transcript_375/g.842  ORF Transcript_375/g.842 Transcript_375/m.842 type:complete len:171 (-) Transcript_375:8-520(-)
MGLGALPIHNKMAAGKPITMVLDDVTLRLPSYFLEQHPGGAEVILALAGRDCTADFDAAGHSKSARAWAKKYAVPSPNPGLRKTTSISTTASELTRTSTASFETPPQSLSTPSSDSSQATNKRRKVTRFETPQEGCFSRILDWDPLPAALVTASAFFAITAYRLRDAAWA